MPWLLTQRSCGYVCLKVLVMQNNKYFYLILIWNIMIINSLMYLGSPQQVASPSVLQLTGQLTIHMAQPLTQHLQQPTTHFPAHCQSPSERQQQSSQAQLQKLVQALRDRVGKMEKACEENAATINEQTMETFYHLKHQLTNRLDAQDQAFLQKTQQLTELEQKLKAKGQQQAKEAQEKLNKRAEDLEEQMKTKMVEFLQEERVLAENMRKSKSDQLKEELKKETREQMKILERNLKQEIKEGIEEEGKTREKLEERIILRMKEDSQIVEVLNNKVVELQKKNERDEKEKSEERKKREKREKRERQEIQKFVDRKTPCAHLFNIHHNNITYQGNNGQWNQIFLDVPLQEGRKLVFGVHITSTHKGSMMIGVVDRHSQAQKQTSHFSGNAVCFYGGDGNRIFYGQYKGYKTKNTEITLKAGMEVEVALDKDTVTFTFHKGTPTEQVIQQSSDILTQPNRLFVPYFSMCNADDSLRWVIR